MILEKFARIFWKLLGCTLRGPYLALSPGDRYQSYLKEYKLTVVSQTYWE